MTSRVGRRRRHKRAKRRRRVAKRRAWIEAHEASIWTVHWGEVYYAPPPPPRK